MSQLQTLEVPVIGMDCAECSQHVQQASANVPGVESANVFCHPRKLSFDLIQSG
jgi:P-type Cu+ transporter